MGLWVGQPWRPQGRTLRWLAFGSVVPAILPRPPLPQTWPEPLGRERLMKPGDQMQVSGSEWIPEACGALAGCALWMLESVPTFSLS